jgi:hypothetical protein
MWVGLILNVVVWVTAIAWGGMLLFRHFQTVVIWVGVVLGIWFVVGLGFRFWDHEKPDRPFSLLGELGKTLACGIIATPFLTAAAGVAYFVLLALGVFGGDV